MEGGRRMKVKKLKKKYNASIPVILYQKGKTKKGIETTVGSIDAKYDDVKIDEIWDGGEKGLEVILKQKGKDE